MNSLIADYLKAIAPHLHPELVSPKALSHIQTVAQVLPPCPFAGFECRLDAKSSRVDFLVKLPKQTANLGARFQQFPAWQTLGEFYQEWTATTSYLHRSIKNLGLEFDLVGQSTQVPIPCILLDLDRETVSEARGLIDLCNNLGSRLPNYPVTPKFQSQLRQCVNSLPDGAKITNLGVMLPRPVEAIRVVVRGIPPQQFSEYLRKIGWSELTNTLSSIVSSLSEFVESLVLSFDVGEIVYPQLGLECHLPQQPQPDRRWAVFLDHLVAKGLCTPEKKEALLAWPGLSQKADNPQLWPAHLTWGDRFVGSNGFSLFWRTIYEIKIVYHPGNLLSAKAYLAFGHDWFDATLLNWEALPKIEDGDRNDVCCSNEAEADVLQYLEQVRNYYDRMNSTILKSVGTSYQALLLKTESGANPYRQTNLYCAKRAGIQPGDRVLDAGCGVCGPSIDIVRAIPGVQIDAITLSGEQAKTARVLVKQAGLADQIKICVGDFHYLPFADEVFDVVMFLESAVYSYNRPLLFAEVYRVLRPGGRLYIKEPFSQEQPSEQQQQELEESDRVYVTKVIPMSEIVEVISTIGFEDVISHDASDIFNTQLFQEAMIEYKHRFPFFTEFGKYHYRPFHTRAGLFGEITACKPGEQFQKVT